VAGTLGLLCNFHHSFLPGGAGALPAVTDALLLAARRTAPPVHYGRADRTGKQPLAFAQADQPPRNYQRQLLDTSPDPLIVLRTFTLLCLGRSRLIDLSRLFGLALVILGIVGTQVISGLVGKAEEGLKRAVWLLAVPIGLIIVVSLLFQPLYLDKALIACSPFYFLLIGWAIFRPDRKR